MTTLDVYTGQAANWDNKAIAIIEFLVERKGEDYTYIEISNTLDIPTAEVSRYLREECFERRSYAWLEKMKKYRPKAYMHYLNNHRIVEKKQRDGTVTKELYVNFSKHAVFLMNCRLRNLRVVYERQGKRRMVHLFEHMENERTRIYYEKAEMQIEDLEEVDTEWVETTAIGDFYE